MYSIKSYNMNLASVKMCKKLYLQIIYIGYNVPKLEKIVREVFLIIFFHRNCAEKLSSAKIFRKSYLDKLYFYKLTTNLCPKIV